MVHVREGFCTSTTRRLRHLALAATLCIGAMGLAAPAAQAASGNLPGGTSIAVTIDTPADGAVVVSPPGDVNLTGTASIGTGVPIADTSLVYVVDVSGSTTGGGGCGGDQNRDGSANRILDCEIAAGRALNQQAISAGTIDQTGVVFFSTSAQTGDVDPVTPGSQGLTAPATDADGSGAPDIEEVLRSAKAIGATNFEAAVQHACQLVQASTNPNNIVVFLSDGVASPGDSAVDDLPCAPKAATFQTFAVGSGSSCTSNPSGGGSLAQIAAATGGTCTPVTDVATLPSVIPGVIDSRLTKLLLSIDGGAAVDISSNATPGLPQAGPASVTYARLISGLAAGTHQLCVTAVGTDGGGEGSVQECRTIVALAAKISINDVTVDEGDTGFTTATFKVTLSEPVPVPVTVNYSTANGTAVAPGDYTAVPSGSITFAPNDTSEDAAVQVRGDTVDEPDETFTVNLSQPTSATISDGTGVGTIVDDERDGAFTCRASALNLLGLLEPVVANRPDAPCKDDSAGLISAALSIVGLGATVGGPNANTDQTPNNLAASPPAIGDKATAHAETTSALISVGISATTTESNAAATCTSSGTPTLSSSSKVVGLQVNGQRFDVLTAPASIPLLLATLRINNTTTTADKVTRRAIWLDNALLPDVIIGEASAGFSGNPCDA